MVNGDLYIKVEYYNESGLYQYNAIKLDDLNKVYFPINIDNPVLSVNVEINIAGVSSC